MGSTVHFSEVTQCSYGEDIGLVLPSSPRIHFPSSLDYPFRRALVPFDNKRLCQKPTSFRLLRSQNRIISAPGRSSFATIDSGNTKIERLEEIKTVSTQTKGTTSRGRSKE